MKTNWTLIAKVFAGEANDKELQDFTNWSQQNDENTKLIDMLKKNWDSVNQEANRAEVDVDKAWINLHKRLDREYLIPGENNQAGRRTIKLRFIQVAAAVIFLAAIGTLSYLIYISAGKSITMTARTLDQQNFGLTLPDGSSVDMNADSKLKFRLQRSGIRMVSLEGEAFFDVRHDAYRPFILKAGKGVVQVTGTEFSVRTVPGTDKIEVYVESGNVQFYRSGNHDRILFLNAGQMGVLEQNRLSEKTNIEPNHLSWKTRKLIFRESRLGDVAGILNRTYSQKIRFTDEALEDCLFTGTFDEQPIDSVIRVIQVAFDLELDHDGKAYVFSGEGCN